MPKQTSIQLTEATQRQLDALTLAGFGNRSDIIRMAIDRMFLAEIDGALDAYARTHHGQPFMVWRWPLGHNDWRFAMTIDGDECNEGGYATADEAEAAARRLIDAEPPAEVP